MYYSNYAGQRCWFRLESALSSSILTSRRKYHSPAQFYSLSERYLVQFSIERLCEDLGLAECIVVDRTNLSSLRT